MAKKGKEPAGLRRWRLAHRKKGGVRHMARRGRKSHRRAGSKTIPVLPVVAAVYPAYRSWQAFGFSKALPASIVYEYTGYNPSQPGPINWAKPTTVGTGLLIAVVAHKVATKFGVNKWIKKATMGYLSL